MRILSTHTSNSTTVEAFEDNVTGEVLFIDGKLSMVLNSKRLSQGVMPVSKMKYWTHQVLCYQHISNS